MIARFFAALLGSLMASAAMAQVSVPQGCEPVATVHKASCLLTHIFDCGSSYQVHGYGRGRILEVHHYSKDWAMTKYTFGDGNLNRFEHDQSSGTGMSLERLLETGLVTESRSTLFSTRVVRGREFSMNNEFTLTEETVVLDGVELRKGNATRVFRRVGTEDDVVFSYDILIEPQRKLYIQGSFVRTGMGNADAVVDATVLGLRFAGQPGFLAPASEFGCSQ